MAESTVVRAEIERLAGTGGPVVDSAPTVAEVAAAEAAVERGQRRAKRTAQRELLVSGLFTLVLLVPHVPWPF